MKKKLEVVKNKNAFKQKVNTRSMSLTPDILHEVAKEAIELRSS